MHTERIDHAYLTRLHYWSTNMLEVKKIDGEPVAVRIGEQEFACEDETGNVTVPEEFLKDFRLSDIPDDIRIKPVDKIEEHTIHINNDVALSHFSSGSALAAVEEMFRRKFWDGETGLSPYVAALRQAIDEYGDAAETDFQDDGDYIFLHYDIIITEDLEIQEAIHFVDAAIERIQNRADQLVTRRRDGLLGIFDRGSFEADLIHALNRKFPVALVMVDIDHFKQVNDTFGHPTGDDALRAVANILARTCDSRSRVPYRYGGEELSIILTGDSAAKPAELAESIRAGVEQFRLNSQPDLRITVSLGIAVAPHVGRNSAELVKLADAALYQAKQEGRNCVRQMQYHR